MTVRGKLTPLGIKMLKAVKEAGECVRYVNIPRWEVNGRIFSPLTGDALAMRGLLRQVVREHDGIHYDRYVPTQGLL